MLVVAGSVFGLRRDLEELSIPSGRLVQVVDRSSYRTLIISASPVGCSSVHEVISRPF